MIIGYQNEIVAEALVLDEMKDARLPTIEELDIGGFLGGLDTHGGRGRARTKVSGEGEGPSKSERRGEAEGVSGDEGIAKAK